MKIGIGVNEVIWDYSTLTKLKIRLSGPHDKFYFMGDHVKSSYYNNCLSINIKHAKRI